MNRQNSLPFEGVGAADAAAVATLANPLADHRLRLRFLVASYSAAPTGGLLTISDGAGVNWTVDLDSTAPLVLPALDLQLGAGATLTVTLAAAGASVVGHINGYCTYE